MTFVGKKCRRCDWSRGSITDIGPLTDDQEMRLRSALEQAEAYLHYHGGRFDWSIRDVGDGDQPCPA